MSLRLAVEIGKVTQVVILLEHLCSFLATISPLGSWEQFPMEWRAERIIIMSQPGFITH